jgi:hypothetical protein
MPSDATVTATVGIRPREEGASARRLRCRSRCRTFHEASGRLQYVFLICEPRIVAQQIAIVSWSAKERNDEFDQAGPDLSACPKGGSTSNVISCASPWPLASRRANASTNPS